MAGPADRFTADKLRWVEQLSLDPGLSRGGLRVGLRIASYLNRQTLDAWPAQETLAAELVVSVRGVRYAVNELLERGHITAARQNRHTSNRYRLAFLTGSRGSSQEQS